MPARVLTGDWNKRRNRKAKGHIKEGWHSKALASLTTRGYMGPSEKKQNKFKEGFWATLSFQEYCNLQGRVSKGEMLK